MRMNAIQIGGYQYDIRETVELDSLWFDADAAFYDDNGMQHLKNTD